MAIKALKGKKVNFPDLIIHRRSNIEGENENNDNLLVIEVKSSSNNINEGTMSNDKIKLHGFVDEEPYNYLLSAHVYISKTKAIIVWYDNFTNTKIDFFNYSKEREELVKSNSISNCAFIRHGHYNEYLNVIYNNEL